MSERDEKILATADDYRFITGAQLVEFHFAAHATQPTAERTARRVLARLRDLRVLGILEQRIGGIRAGSDGLVYHLGTVGDRLLRQINPQRSRRRFEDPSTRFLEHALAISGAAAGLHTEARRRGGEVVRLAPERPRRYTDMLGAGQTIRPDLYAELAAVSGAEDIAAFFIEVDLGQESIPTLVGKSLAYEDYRRSGNEQRQCGGFPVVVWAMTAARAEAAQRRRDALAKELARHHRIDIGQYRIVALEDAPARIFKEVRHG
ncbi:replication-relaxation family protein [Sinomonas albida]|uniref:replication-relaxation family protein n=1 Tax=Sinomonas albida TaxID=369942 RepID=UPI003017F425